MRRSCLLLLLPRTLWTESITGRTDGSLTLTPRFYSPSGTPSVMGVLPFGKVTQPRTLPDVMSLRGDPLPLYPCHLLKQNVPLLTCVLLQNCLYLFLDLVYRSLRSLFPLYSLYPIITPTGSDSHVPDGGSPRNVEIFHVDSTLSSGGVDRAPRSLVTCLWGENLH